MTKKDYIKIAATLKESKPELSNNYTATEVTLMECTWKIAVNLFADMLAKDNPLFDRRRFLVACGYTD